ncbi:MAG: hypothetical protein HYY16_16905 [Planctomycetes bacterium]|nr:hypothetical protein [Planctomycetota bacterium]
MAETNWRKRVEELEAEVDRLALMCRALQELSVKKRLFTRKEIQEMIQEIDAVDGHMDGRETRIVPPPRED